MLEAVLAMVNAQDELIVAWWLWEFCQAAGKMFKQACISMRSCFASSEQVNGMGCRVHQQYSRRLSLTMRICIPIWAYLATWAWCKSKGDSVIAISLALHIKLGEVKLAQYTAWLQVAAQIPDDA